MKVTFTFTFLWFITQKYFGEKMCGNFREFLKKRRHFLLINIVWIRGLRGKHKLGCVCHKVVFHKLLLTLYENILKWIGQCMVVRSRGIEVLMEQKPLEHDATPRLRTGAYKNIHPPVLKPYDRKAFLTIKINHNVCRLH